MALPWYFHFGLYKNKKVCRPIFSKIKIFQFTMNTKKYLFAINGPFLCKCPMDSLVCWQLFDIVFVFPSTRDHTNSSLSKHRILSYYFSKCFGHWIQSCFLGVWRPDLTSYFLPTMIYNRLASRFRVNKPFKFRSVIASKWKLPWSKKD